jgi:hypothetical protein
MAMTIYPVQHTQVPPAMSFLTKLRSSLGSGAPANSSRELYPITVRCRRCGEELTVAVNLSNDLSQDYERDVWFVRKLISGSGANRCFQQIEVQLTFDANKRLLEREISGGSFVDEVGSDA